MKKLVIYRVYDNLQTKGYGIMIEAGKIIYKFVTIELPDNGNQRNTSCIPEGKYIIEKYISPSKGRCFHVLDVPGRDNILIHVGNYAAGNHVDTLGCILPGSRFEDLNDDGNLDVIESTNTLKDLLILLPDKTELHII